MREKRRLLDPFWLSVGLVVLFGTIGGVLYKMGTNQIQGGVSLDRLLQVELSARTLPYLFLLFLSVGLFFFAGYSLRDRIFAADYLFAPVIFLALIMLSLSRFMIGIPLSQRGLGELTGLLTPLVVGATAFASWLVLRESFTPRAVLGIGLGMVAVYLIGER
ncbi:MAG TPA: hypothetical protein VIH83_06615 [Candidatus Bathyarchaeia archaeon]